MAVTDPQDPFAAADDFVEVEIDEIQLQAGAPIDDRLAQYIAWLRTRG